MCNYIIFFFYTLYNRTILEIRIHTSMVSVAHIDIVSFAPLGNRRQSRRKGSSPGLKSYFVGEIKDTLKTLQVTEDVLFTCFRFSCI